MRRLITGFLILLSAVPLIAAETEKSVTAHLPLSPLGGGALLETLAGLFLVLLLIFGLARLLRRYGRLPLGGKGDITVLSGVSLGPRERAVLLQVGKTRLLVGVAPGRVQTLHVMGDLPEDEEATPTVQKDFSGQLERELKEELQ
ncbi:MAG: flagellar biosynthetic protein FliO [Sedimenticola sp.]